MNRKPERITMKFVQGSYRPPRIEDDPEYYEISDMPPLTVEITPQPDTVAAGHAMVLDPNNPPRAFRHTWSL